MPTKKSGFIAQQEAVGFIFRGNISQVLKTIWETLKKSGTTYKSQRGEVKSLKAVTVAIEDPLNDSKNYPYWDKKSDDWYQDNFVRKETNTPPEIIKHSTSGVEFVFPYKYAWRSRYYDSGIGYVKAVVKTIQATEYRVQNKKQLIQLLKETYTLIHPEILLAVLAWKGTKLINFYMKNPKILDLELERSRMDTLDLVINELKHSPNSRRAITPSFIYPQIDHSGAAGGVPVYQNYQLFVNFDSKGKAKSLTSFHLHRAFDARGGMQLDINHDKDWGKIASKKLGLPLESMIIYGNDVWISEDAAEKDIKSWLFSVTNAYDPKLEDIEKKLSSENYQKKIEYTLRSI